MNSLRYNTENARALSRRASDQHGGADMKIITLTKGQITKVSDHRFDFLSKFKWQALWDKHTNTYRATRGEYDSSGKHKTIYMHREIMNTPKAMKCDHINGDTLDNQDENLRNCTNSENTKNSKRRSDNTSGYKGVTPSFGKWRARVRKDGVALFSETFEDVVEAAIAYDREAKKHHGEFARLNFPEGK